jgi:hypothetical protein
MMTCGKSLEIEFTEFLADPRAAAFAAFRAHYPRCAECAAEVRAWTELHGRLSAAHPDPESLARYEDLAPEERAALDRHLAGCSSCREELAGLAAFNPQRLAAGVSTVPAREPRSAGLREALASLGRLFWHPAFAYALLGMLLLPTLYRSVGPGLEARAPQPADLAVELESVEERLALPVADEQLAEPEPAVAPRVGVGRGAWQAAAPPAAERRLAEAKSGAEPERGASKRVAAALEEPERAAPRARAAPAEKPLAFGDERGSAPRAARRRDQTPPSQRAVAEVEGAVAEGLEPPSAADALEGARREPVAAEPLVAAPALSKALPSALLAHTAALRLDAQRRVEIDLPLDRALELRIPVPAGTPTGGEVSVRIPSGWLDAGAYRIELQLPAGAPGAERPIRFSLAVNAPRR